MQTGREKGLKVVLLGNSGTGKTSIVHYMMTGTPNKGTMSTIMCQGNSIAVDIGSNVVDLRVWDTAGQELYRSIVPIYLRGSMAAVLVYDITDVRSFQAIERWHSLLLEEVDDSVIVYVVGNKIDLGNFVVSEEDARRFANKLNAKFMQVSAMDGTGIKQLFEGIARDLFECGKPTEMKSIRVDSQQQETGGCGC